MITFLFENYRRSYFAAAIFYGFVGQIYFELLNRVAANKPDEIVAAHVAVRVKFRFARYADVTGVFKTAVIEKVGVSIQVYVAAVFYLAVVFCGKLSFFIAVQINLARVFQVAVVDKSPGVRHRRVKQYLPVILKRAVVDKRIAFAVFLEVYFPVVLENAVVYQRMTVHVNRYAF